MTGTDTSRDAVEQVLDWLEEEATIESESAGELTELAKTIWRHEVTVRTLLARAEKAEAERDTAWNDAIEAAADEVTNWHSCDGECVRSLKKGDPT